jgi:tetratricopeptide (TPR) repeat protein
MVAKRRSIYIWGLAAAAIVGALVFAWHPWTHGTRLSQEQLPAPTATTPNLTDRPRILIADFADRSEGQRTESAPEEKVYQALLDRVRGDSLDLHVARLNEVADEFSATHLGRSNDATLVVWGWYDGTRIQPHVEQIEAPPGRLSNHPFCTLDDPPTQIPHLVSFVLGVYTHSQGRYVQAIKHLEPATTQDFECAAIHNQRGLAQQALGNHNAALAAFSRAIALEPEVAGFYANRGVTFEIMEQYHAAHADFARAWELTRDLATVFN